MGLSLTSVVTAELYTANALNDATRYCFLVFLFLAQQIARVLVEIDQISIYMGPFIDINRWGNVPRKLWIFQNRDTIDECWRDL